MACLGNANRASAADGVGGFDGKGAHPGMTVAPVTALGNVATMGIAWLSNGDMVWARSTENYGGGSVPGPSAQAGVWIVKNITTNPTVSQLAVQFRQPSGVAVGPGDEIMVPDRDAIYKLTSTGTKTKVMDNPTAQNQANSSPTTMAWHQWIFCPMYYNGRYYAPYSGSIQPGGPSGVDPSSDYSGAVLSWTSTGSGGFQKYAGGLRSPNGAGIGSGSQAGFMMFTDNQGSWEPSCPLNLIKQNGFYGHRQNTNFTANWAQAAYANGSMPYVPPVAWMLDNDASAPNGLNGGGAGQATSQPVYLDRGPFAGDWVVGDINQQQLARVALDPVNGGTGVGANYNGSIQFFTGGFGNSAINRLSMHPTANVLYVGTASTASCNWPCAGLKPFYSVTFDDNAIKAAFEIVSVKSRSNGVEVIFSQPVDPATAVAGSFRLGQFNITRGDGYGAGNTSVTAPTISAVQISNDHRRVFLQIGNTAAVNRVQVIFGAGLRAETGGAALFFDHSWFTHNYQSTVAFDPAGPTSVRPTPDAYMLNHITHTVMRPGVLHVSANLTGGPYTVSLRSMNGAMIEGKSGSAPAEFDFQVAGKGIYVLEAVQGERRYSRPLVF